MKIMKPSQKEGLQKHAAFFDSFCGDLPRYH